MATDPATLLSQSNCYACYGIGGTFQLLELVLVAQWSNQNNVAAALVNAWVARAKANGGNPSQKSINAVTTFANGMQAAGLLSKMIHLNPIAGDDYPTATTPLIVGPGGHNQWKDQDGTLQAQQTTLSQGLQGDANYQNTAAFGTGVIIANCPVSQLNSGISLYISVQEPDGTNHTHGGCDGGNGGNGQTNQFKFIYDFEFISMGASGSNGFTASSNSGAWAPFAGFTSANVVNNGVWSIGSYGYVNGALTWPIFTKLNQDGGGGNVPANLLPTVNDFWWLNSSGTFPEVSGETISFAAFHQGLTFAQASTMFTLVQAMRVAMGGGYL